MNEAIAAVKRRSPATTDSLRARTRPTTSALPPTAARRRKRRVLLKRVSHKHDPTLPSIWALPKHARPDPKDEDKKGEEGKGKETARRRPRATERTVAR
ncbi:hypothetical protein MVLG_02848 [Microbotryum lychnidis-dioicae p1A1 Lamole]|uniref:Uncharacterized protein n=1 Tax=Microbotryum lychnidis-dioicae (strain p1A1 Lamole / MvSl-1064) TaxID=683840 RepID=U5H6E7_USTV1|nr:hypothetical protein MVLG_02848 [Microbotryum lychnidis-dioicae p1A1 Lamole]|eukprot:KDE06811.1 hypothetical protein MVLG_02848 [Microbotryum lychnidis-dioicae p1A1 Lamole]